MVRPNELIAVYWLMMLDQSTSTGEPGAARTFNHEIVVSEWAVGNLTIGALRVLTKVISRASKADELDAWDYRAEYQEWSRDMIGRLRKGELSIRQVEKLHTAKAKSIADAKKRAKYEGLSPAEIASIEASEKNSTLQAKLAQLGARALDVQKFAAKELKKGGAELKEFLATRGIIPPKSS